MKDLSVQEKILRAYFMECETSFVPRGGTIALKILLSVDEVENLYELPEWVSEHSLKAAFFARNYADAFSGSLGKVSLVQTINVHADA